MNFRRLRQSCASSVRFYAVHRRSSARALEEETVSLSGRAIAPFAGCSPSENLCGFDLGLPVHVVQELAACAFYIRALRDGGSFKGFALSCPLSGIFPDQCQATGPLGAAGGARWSGLSGEALGPSYPHVFGLRPSLLLWISFTRT